MANRSYRNFEDELAADGMTPDTSISDRVEIPDYTAQAMQGQEPEGVQNLVSQAVMKSRQPPPPSPPPVDIAQDPMMKQYALDQQNVDKLREAKRGSDFISNMSQAFSTVAQGSNAPKQNNLSEQMGKQSSEMLRSGEEDLDRRNKVMNAIEARKTRLGTEQGHREDRKLQREQIAATNNLARQDRMGKEAKKLEDRDLSLAVPGYERTGEVLPKTEEAMKLRGALASADQLTNKLGRLRDLVKQYGTFEYGGEGGAEMESIATEIQLLAKNKDMYDLGVLTGPDMGLLQKITADPASMGSLFTREGTRMKQIDSQLQSIQDKIGASSKSMGYKRKGMSAPQESSVGEKQVAKKQYSPSRNQTKIIYADGSEEIIDGQG